MNLISFSINRPVAIVAVVLMVVLFGYVALQRIPIQMAPDVRQPVIIVQTFWPGSAPAEVEREIVNRQEEVLKGLEGIRSMQSRSRTGRAEVTLEFAPSQNMDRALLLVANRLDRVTGYPAEANEPLLRTSGTDDNAIAWFLLTRKPGNDRDMITYGDFLEDVVQERIERIEGISAVNIYGETKRELRIVIDAQRLAQYRLTISDVLKRVRAENASISGGNVEEGKRSYVVRTEGDLNRPEQVRNIVLRSEYISGKERIGRVTVGDVAKVYLSYKKARAIAHNFDERAMAFNMTRSQGANVLQTMSKVHLAVKELGISHDDIKKVGAGVVSNDATVPIGSSYMFSYETKAGEILIRLIDWRTNDEGVIDHDNPNRGRLTPNWTIAPFFEHVKQNEFGY